MGANRIFISHAIRSENEGEAKILCLVMDVLQKAGMEIVTYTDNGSEESFFQQLQQELPTCQTFLLLQTPNAVSTPQIHQLVKAAQGLFKQNKIYGAFRFICSSAERITIPQEWKSLTTFDGTRNYQRACTRLVLNILATYKNKGRGSGVITTGFSHTLTPVEAELARDPAPSSLVGVGLAPAHTLSSEVQFANVPNSIPIEAAETAAIPLSDLADSSEMSSEARFTHSSNDIPINEAETAALPLSDLAGSSETSSQTTFTHSPKTINIAEDTSKTAETKKIIESLPTQAIRMLQVVPAESRPLQVSPTEAVRTSTPPPAPRAIVPQKPPRPNYDRPPKRSWWKKLLRNEETGRPSLFMNMLIALVILLVIGSVGNFLFLNIKTAPSAAKSALPPPNPTLGQVSFFGSDQIGAENNTGVADEVRVNLQQLKPPAAGHNYYAWLLNTGNSKGGGLPLFLGNVTVNKGSASLSFTNPTHENLLLTKSSFLITEESASPTPSIPSTDQHVWRYFGTLSQDPNPKDPNHFSNFDHVQHLLAADPLLQGSEIPGGLSTWFYRNVQKVFEWSNAAQGTGEQQGFDVVHRNLVRIMDYLDGADLVAAEVPEGTPIVVEPAQYANIPLLTFDLVHQNPPGYIVNLETNLQGLSTSLDATDAQRALASQMDDELEKVNGFLFKVHEDAKQLVKLSQKDLADPKNAPIFTDMVNNANNAYQGQLDPVTNKRQGGATLVHDLMPRIATIDVKAFTSL